MLQLFSDKIQISTPFIYVLIYFYVFIYLKYLPLERNTVN